MSSIQVQPQNEESFQITDRDMVIALMGPTGSGKSTFVNQALGRDCVLVGNNMHSCTREVQMFSCPHPKHSDRRVFLVDTPGFDDTHMFDTDVLQAIAQWLETTYRRGITLTGLLFFHRITDNRMGGTLLRNSIMFRRLCGAEALPNVILVTTMWDEIECEAGNIRERELHENYWNAMIQAGSRSLRSGNSFDSAWEIIDHLQGTPQVLKLQWELVVEQKPLVHTAAGSALFQWLENFISQLRDLLLKLEALLRGKNKAPDSVDLVNKAAATKAQLRDAREQKRKLNNTSRRTESPEPLDIPHGSDRRASGSSWSLLSTSSDCIDYNVESPRAGKLVTTISVLKHTQCVANGTPFAPLKGAVALLLNIAETVQNMRRNDQALISLTQTAARFVVILANRLAKEEITADAKEIVLELMGEFKAIQHVVSRRVSRRSRARHYLTWVADADFIAACHERLNAACQLFEVRYAILNGDALWRLERAIAAHIGAGCHMNSSRQLTTVAQRAQLVPIRASSDVPPQEQRNIPSKHNTL